MNGDDPRVRFCFATFGLFPPLELVTLPFDPIEQFRGHKILEVASVGTNDARDFSVSGEIGDLPPL